MLERVLGVDIESEYGTGVASTVLSVPWSVVRGPWPVECAEGSSRCLGALSGVAEPVPRTAPLWLISGCWESLPERKFQPANGVGL